MFRRSWLFAAPKKKAVNARAQSKTAGRTVAAASAPPSPLSPPPPRHSTLAPPPVASPTGAVSLVAAPRPVAPPPMKPAIPSRPPSLVSSQTPSSVATKITASTGALLPADVIQKKAEIERRRMEKDPVDREFELGCTERAYPAVPRALALSGIHFSDRHLRQILRIGGGDASGSENSVTGEDDGSIGALPRRVPVRLNELTVNECELLFKHLALLAEGVRDARRFPSTADLPALECVNKDASPTQVFHCLTRNAELAAGAVTDSAATVPFTEVSDKYLRLPDVSTDDLRLCTPRTTDVTPDTEGVVFTMALENCNVSVGLEILRSRWNLARKNFNCAINGPSRSCNVVLVFAVGVPPGCLLNVNVMRFHGHVVRVSNLRRCTLATYKAMTATSQLETVVALRRVACPAPLLEARLRAVAASGCLRYAITGTSAKGATVMYHLVRGEPNQALAAWLDDDDAHPAIKLFLMSPSRTTAHKIVNDPKNKRLHATPQFRALRVLGASGSSTAAMCALPVDVRSGLARETYATAFNSMLSKRQRTHGTKVVVGDTVRVTAESRSEFVTADDVKRVETDEEASQYTIDDVVLPWLAGTAVKAEHFPTCPGLTLAECIELLTPLNLAWMLPGCRPPTCRSFFDDEFTFCHKDDRETVWYRLVWSRPQVEVKVVAHPPPFSGDHHDATLLLPHDRGCLARRSSPVLPDGDTAPFALVKQLPREVSGAQTTWPTTRESKTAATSIAPVAAPHQRLVMPVMGYRRYALGPQSRVTTGKSFVSGYTIRDATGSLVTMDVKGEPVYRESTLPEDDFESVCHVVTAVLRFTHQFASDPNGLLRELFIQHGVTSDIDAGLQHAVHAHVAAKDTELDLSLADQYCADCFSVKHTSAACPLRLAFDAAHAAMIEARALEARQKSVRLSTPVLMTRASTAVKWGLSVEENGEIGSVVRGSPAFLCLESQLPEALLDQPFELLAGGHKKTPTAALPSPSSAAVLPREIVENTSTAKVDAIVPVQARIKVVAVNGVFCDGAEAVAEAVGRAADPLKVELSIRVMRRVLRDNQRPTRERPNTGTMMKPNKKRQQLAGGGG